MKKLILILILIPFFSIAQSNVPEKYWIDDSNFEEKINERNAFGDDKSKPIVVEFWAQFNEANCFGEWKELEDVIYYRVDIAKAPKAKKKYKVRMVPTLVIFKEGIKEIMFKAGLDLVLPAELNEIQEAVNEINTASRF